MRILVTGREGQVARSLAEQAGGHDLVFVGRPELDLAQPDTIEAAVARVHPDLIISAAAYTAVDKAESEMDLALAINGTAPGMLARAGARIGAPYYGPRYVIGDPWRYHLPRAGRYQSWVRHYNDVLLIDTRRGVVIRVLPGFYW